MKNVLERMKAESSSDSADASIITSLMLLPVVFFLLISVIDVGFYFMNEATVTKAAREGAETAATLGGVGSAGFYAVAEHNYPARKSQSDLARGTNEFGFTVRNTIEYLVAEQLVQTNSTYELHLDDVTCYVYRPEIGSRHNHRVQSLGHRPICEVSWRYDGLPLSGWGMVQSRDDSGEIETTLTAGVATADLLTEGGNFNNQQYPRP